MSSKLKRKRTPAWRRRSMPAVPDRLAEALRLHQTGDVDAAVARYESILADAPDHVDARHFLGVALHQRGHSEQALAQLDRVLALAPGHADAFSNRGNVRKELGRLDEAEQDYRRALALRPDDANALNNLGTVLRCRGKLEEARATFERVLALQPTLAGAWQNLGNTLGDLERLDESLTAHREAMRLAPQSARSYHYVGRMLYAVGRLDEAIDTYRQWLARFPDDPIARHFVAACTGNEVPSRASDAFVRNEFDIFAATFDTSLAALGYRAPAVVGEAMDRLYGAGVGSLAILDAGCGTGLCGPRLRPFARQLVGVDLSAAMIAQARRRSLYDDLVEGELTAYLTAHPGRWDVIASADTLNYFGDLQAVLQAAARALRPAGAIVFTVEAAYADEPATGFRLNPHGRYSHSVAYLRDVLADAGVGDVAVAAVTLRKEAHRWVDGYLVSARRAPEA